MEECGQREADGDGLVQKWQQPWQQRAGWNEAGLVVLVDELVNEGKEKIVRDKRIGV